MQVLAFGLGALTSMPAVRNFSICAAIAVGLDFLLQVRGEGGCALLSWQQAVGLRAAGEGG